MTITGFSVEQVKDPFGILPGERYEFLLDIDVPEDDELHSEQGLYIRVVYTVGEERTGIVKYDIFERTTEKYLEFDLEDEELEAVDAFCREHWKEAGNE